jgi:hypothetical protein
MQPLLYINSNDWKFNVFWIEFSIFSGCSHGPNVPQTGTKQFKEHKPEDILHKKICEENDCFASRYIKE